MRLSLTTRSLAERGMGKRDETSAEGQSPTAASVDSIILGNIILLALFNCAILQT